MVVFIGYSRVQQDDHVHLLFSGLILGLRPAIEKRRYKVTPSLIGWVRT